jgi:hypothetical protein
MTKKKGFIMLTPKNNRRASPFLKEKKNTIRIDRLFVTRVRFAQVNIG